MADYILIMIIIITLFQEDNIFGTNASLTIWSSNTKAYMRLIITDRSKIIYSMYRAVRSPYTEHAASGQNDTKQILKSIKAY